MIILTNSVSQVLAPGQSLTFDTEVIHTGCAECHRVGSGAVSLCRQKAIYDVVAKANIGATTADSANLAVFIDGSPLSETAMVSATAAAGDLDTVSCETSVQTCCCAPNVVTVVNNGTTTVNVDSPLLKIRRVA